jgi:hypothetical protein
MQQTSRSPLRLACWWLPRAQCSWERVLHLDHGGVAWRILHHVDGQSKRAWDKPGLRDLRLNDGLRFARGVTFSRSCENSIQHS